MRGAHGRRARSARRSAADYLAQPNVVCIGGSWMVPGDWIDNGQWDKVRDSAANAAAIVRRVRAG